MKRDRWDAEKQKFHRVTVRRANDDKAGKAFETQIKCKANSYFNNSLS